MQNQSQSDMYNYIMRMMNLYKDEANGPTTINLNRSFLWR